MEKEIDGCVIEKTDDLVTISRFSISVTKPMMSIWHRNEQVQIEVHDNIVEITLAVLQTAVEMLAEPEKTADKKFVCRECLDHPNTISFLPMNPERTFCQKVGKDLNNLPDKKCPL